MWSCGLLWGDRIHRSMTGWCISKRGYLTISLMALEKSSHGLRTSLCSTIISHLLRTDPLPLAGQPQYCFYGRRSQWWGVGPSHAPHNSPFTFLRLWHLGSSCMICGFHAGLSWIGWNSWLPPTLVTCGIGNLFGLCAIFFLYTHGDGIGVMVLKRLCFNPRIMPN